LVPACPTEEVGARQAVLAIEIERSVVAVAVVVAVVAGVHPPKTLVQAFETGVLGYPVQAFQTWSVCHLRSMMVL